MGSAIGSGGTPGQEPKVKITGTASRILPGEAGSMGLGGSQKTRPPNGIPIEQFLKGTKKILLVTGAKEEGMVVGDLSGRRNAAAHHRREKTHGPKIQEASYSNKKVG